MSREPHFHRLGEPCNESCPEILSAEEREAGRVGYDRDEVMTELIRESERLGLYDDFFGPAAQPQHTDADPQ